MGRTQEFEGWVADCLARHGTRPNLERKGNTMTYKTALAGLQEHTNALRLAVVEEHDYPLVANQLREIEVDLAKKRREIEGLATELAQSTRDADPSSRPFVMESDRGSLVEVVKRSYSFNTPGLLIALMDSQEWPIGKAITEYQATRALRLDWKISFLRQTAERYEFDLPTARHEITDDDPDYLVGVVSTSKMERQ